MGVTKFVSSAKLAEYLEQEILEVLNTRGLYDISRYGWLDDDIPDPDYRGIALWLSGDVAVPDSGRMARLRELGDGFVSRMRSSLHSLGLAIVFANACGEEMSIFSEETVRFHCHDTAMKLGLAALGLRDFFMILNGQEGEVVHVLGQGGRMDSAGFHAPFAAALAEHMDDLSLASLYVEIERLAAEIADRCRVCERLGRELGGAAGLPMIVCAGDAGENADMFAEGIWGVIGDLCGWHELMIAAGNHVFMLFAALAGRHAPAAGRVTARGV